MTTTAKNLHLDDVIACPNDGAGERIVKVTRANRWTYITVKREGLNARHDHAAPFARRFTKAYPGEATR